MKKIIGLSVLAFLFSSPVSSASPYSSLNGLWAEGNCETPEYSYYVFEGMRYVITQEGVTSFRPLEAKQRGKYLVEMWPIFNEQFALSYTWRENEMYRSANKVIPTSGLGEISLDSLPSQILPDSPPDSWKIRKRMRCARLPGELSFVHGEAIAFLLALQPVVSSCETNPENCVDNIILVADVSKNGKLSKAEISRVIRIVAYFGIVGSKEEEMKPALNEDLMGTAGIAALVAPFIASSVIDGSDYDGDGQLSMKELFLDREIGGTGHTMEKVSFDVATKLLSTFFQSVSGMGGLLK